VLPGSDPAEPEAFGWVQIAIYTAGRFLWSAAREANPAFVFDQVSIDTLKAKGVTFEATFSGSGNY
jgi:hypothetical protein